MLDVECSASSLGKTAAYAMIARVTLEIALRKEFDYFIPPELEGEVDVGSRVQVPFGARKVLGCVTGMAEESAHASLKAILKVIGTQTLVTPKILKRPA
jgi:primosomal protein N' (replication factor Y)